MELIKLLLTLGILTRFSSATPFNVIEERTSSFADVGYRLPYTVWPSLYEIDINPNLNEFTFSGSVKITFNTTEDNVTSIILHAKDLVIDNVELPTPLTINGSHKLDSIYDFLSINFSPALEVNEQYLMTIRYRGKIQDDMTGFYRSSYVENGTTKWLATTQFQPVHARKAFPCFDEPLYKAKFQINFVCPTGFYCRSNMPSKNGLEQALDVSFEETPLMSTYLVAFVVSEFKPANESDDGDDDLRILARPDAKDMGDYAFKVGRDLQVYMDKYFDYPYYTMNDKIKMDHIAIPDFGAGAMENWGLVTYREAYLMYEPGETSVRYKQLIATILSHEILHMWFGNLITCHWWSDIWLNEGFARFYQFYATEEVDSFGLKDQFIVAQVHTAMAVDNRLGTAHLTNLNVNSPDEIWAHFSTISYNKGAAVIRMIQHWIGNDSYVEGLRELLHKKEFQTIIPDDLFAALQDKANTSTYNTSVREVMLTWTTQGGHPIITVNVDRTANSIQITQQRFLRYQQECPNIYHIPITFTMEGSPDFTNTKPSFIMKTGTHNINQRVPGWIVFNVQQTGYYRVNYDPQTWNLLIAALNSPARTTIHEYNRAQIVDDAFNMAQERVISYSLMLDIIQFLESETQYTPWQAAYAGFNSMRLHFGKSQLVSQALDDHISKLMESLIDDIGLDDTGNNLRMLFRTNTLNLACNLKHDACVNSSIAWFRNLRSVPATRVPVNLREHVYCNGLRYGNISDYQFLWKKHDETNVVSEKIVILGALGCTTNEILIMDYLAKTLDENSGIRAQDRMAAFNSALTGNPSNAEVVLRFVLNGVERIRRVYGSSNLRVMLSNIVIRLPSNHLKTMEDFLETSPSLTVEEKAAVSAAIDNAKAELQRVSLFENEIHEWLENKYSSGTNLKAFSIILLLTITIFISN